MNRICIWLLAAASAVCLCMLPRTGTDAAKLLPAQVLVIGAGDGVVTVEADNGAAGSGPTLGERQVMIGAVHALDGKRDDVSINGAHVSRAFHRNHGPRLEFLQFGARRQRDVVCPPINALARSTK